MPFPLLLFESAKFITPKNTKNLLRNSAFSQASINTPLQPTLNAPIFRSRLVRGLTEEELNHLSHSETGILGLFHLMVKDRPVNLEDKMLEHKHIVFPRKSEGLSPFISTSLYNHARAVPWNSANIIRRHYSHSAASAQKKKVAVVLSGCGVQDGSEIQESVSVLTHLSRVGVEASCFAPNIAQADTINHFNATNNGEKRNVLIESARIARGNIKPLSDLLASDYIAVIFPGGYGVAKNLSTFASNGEKCTIQTDVERVIKEFHEAKKPIGLCCIAPVLAAKLIPGVQVTLGNEDKATAKTVESMGAVTQAVGVNEIVVDEKNNVVSTPAYMVVAPLHEIFNGIGKLVESVVERAK